MRIGLKLTAAFLSIASLVGVAGYLAHGTSTEVEQQMDRLSRGVVRKVADAAQITVALYANQLAAHAHLHASRTPPTEEGQPAVSPQLHGSLEQHQATVEDALARQNQLAESMIRWADQHDLPQMADHERKETLESLRQLSQEYEHHLQIQAEFLALVGQDADQAERFLENRLCGHFETELLPRLEDYRADAANELTQSVRATERAMVVADQRRGWLILTAAAGAVLMGLFTSRAIGRPLVALQRAAEDIGRGRFDVHVPVRSHDEIGMLARSINQMAADLRETTITRSYLDNIIQSMRDMLIVVDPDFRIRDANQAACEQLQYAREDLIDRSLRELFGPEELREADGLFEFLSSGIECALQTRTGTSIPVHCSAAKMLDHRASLEGYVYVASNISRQKEAEDQLVASLREKELLLKEVHHRVKNNLQVISSLLNLQANALQDPDTATLFHESQGRVRSMALIHEQLYQSEDLARIDFAAYVQDLVQHLKRGLADASNEIEFRLNIEPLPLPIEWAIPCGMIVNELVSNAQKHAFPAGRPGEIRIEFARRSDTYCLAVADNGVGIPAKDVLERAGPSLGLKVVQALTRQLHGELEVQQDAGTRFVIRFHPEMDGSP